MSEALSRHIAIFLPSLRGGGAERVMVCLANGFARRGHRVDLLIASPTGPFLSEVSPRVRLVIFNKCKVRLCLFLLARYLRRERPNALLSAMTHANLIAIFAKILARSRTRLVVSERNSLEVFGKDQKSKFLLCLIAWFYPWANRIVSVTRAGKRELIERIGLPSDSIVAIPNPVDVKNIRALSSFRPDHPWLAPGEPPVVLAVGRLVKEKDYSTLLAAFARLSMSLPARLVILGEGILRHEIELEIQRRRLSSTVALLGFDPNPFGWMAACSAYVLWSRNEGFPNSLVQAMACGAPVVSTDCATGPSEILEGGKWGQLIPVGDEVALADALDLVLRGNRHEGVLERLSEYGVEEILCRYERVLLPALISHQSETQDSSTGCSS